MSGALCNICLLDWSQGQHFSQSVSILEDAVTFVELPKSNEYAASQSRDSNIVRLSYLLSGSKMPLMVIDSSVIRIYTVAHDDRVRCYLYYDVIPRLRPIK